MVLPLLLTTTLCAFAVPQDEPLARYEQAMRAGITALREGSRPRHLRAARDRFREALATVPGLPEPRRAQARFFARVRLGEVYLRSGRGDNVTRAAEQVRRARREARTAGVYQGPYRALTLVLLWQALPAPEFEELLATGDDRAWLASPAAGEAVERAPYLRWPVRALRLDVDPDRGPRDWHALLADLAPATTDPAVTPWRRLVLQRLFSFAWLERDVHRARLYLDQLPPDQTRLPRGMVALALGDAATAERLGRAVAEDGEPRAWQLVADALELQGKVGPALAAYRRARPALDDDDVRAANHDGAGDCLLRLGRLDEAEAAFRRALALLGDRSGAGALGERVEVLKDLGLLAERRGRTDRALRHYHRALDEQERLRARVPPGLFGSTAFAAHPDQLTAVDGLLRLHGAAGEGWAALAALERVAGRTVHDVVHAGTRLEDTTAWRRAVHRIARAGGDDLDGAVLALDVERAMLEAEIERPSTPPPRDAAALRAALEERPGLLVLAYWIGEEEAFAVQAAAGRCAVHRLGTRAEVLAHTRAVFRAVADPAGGAGEALGAAAAVLLPEPVRRAVDRATHVLVVPDVEIARLPFEALPGPGGALGLRRPVTRSPSLSVALSLAGRAAAGGPAWVVEYLPDAGAGRREVDDVSRAREARVLAGEEASFTNLRDRLAAPPRLLHVNAHAVEHAFVPSRSLLELADGPLTAASVRGLDLRGSETVLSACATAAGEVRRGEGVAGLTTGAFAAGARTVLASLWRVDRRATADLMSQYHHHRGLGVPPAEALRRARGRLAAHGPYGHPHYWAGFGVLGALDPVAGGDAGGAWWWPAGALAAVLLLLAGVRLSSRAAGRRRPKAAAVPPAAST